MINRRPGRESANLFQDIVGDELQGGFAQDGMEFVEEMFQELEYDSDGSDSLLEPTTKTKNPSKNPERAKEPSVLAKYGIFYGSLKGGTLIAKFMSLMLPAIIKGLSEEDLKLRIDERNNTTPIRIREWPIQCDVLKSMIHVYGTGTDLACEMAALEINHVALNAVLMRIENYSKQNSVPFTRSCEFSLFIHISPCNHLPIVYQDTVESTAASLKTDFGILDAFQKYQNGTPLVPGFFAGNALNFRSAILGSQVHARDTPATLLTRQFDMNGKLYIVENRYWQSIPAGFCGFLLRMDQ